MIPSFNIAPGESAEDVAMKRRLAMQMLSSGTDTSPVQHWTQGAARMAQALMGGMAFNQARQDDAAERTKGNEMLAALLNPGGQQGAPMNIVHDMQNAPPSVQPPPAPQYQPGTPNARVSEGFAALEQPAATGNVPRGYRNNNPLNIEAGPFALRQPGFQGSDGRFAKFASLDQGVGAAKTLLDVYQNKHGLNTVEGIIGRWAPAGDGNNVSAYAANVARQLGIAPNEPIPPEMRDRLIGAMAQHENGKPLPQVAQAPSPPSGPAPQQAQAAPGMNREMLIKMLGNRYTAPMAQEILKQQIARDMNPGKPEFGVIGEDEYGKKNYGWIDPKNRSVTPMRSPSTAQPQRGAPSAVDAIPEPPPGADPKKWRETFTKEAAERVAGAPQAKARAQDAIANMYKTGQEALRLATHEGLDAAVGPISGRLPTFRDKTANFESDVGTLGTRIFINTINRMRELSKTGGAVGGVTEKEMMKLENSLKSLDLTQGEGNMRKNLRGIAREFNDSMKIIADAYKTQYGEEMPYQALEVPNDAPASGGGRKTKTGVQWSVD